MLTPNARPPRTARDRAQRRSFPAQSEIPRGSWGASDLTMLFVGVVRMSELVEEEIRLRESGDLLGGKQGGKPFLPEVVSAFDFPFCLRSGCKA